MVNEIDRIISLVEVEGVIGAPSLHKTAAALVPRATVMSARILQGGSYQLTSTTFLQDLIESFIRNADKPFVEEVKKKRTFTFRETHEDASGFARKLQELGLKPSDVVMFLSNVTAEAINAIFGTWISGAATSCVNPKLPIGEIQELLRTCKSRVVYCGEEFLDHVMEAVNGMEYPITVIVPNGKPPLIDYYDCIKNKELVTTVDQPLGGDHWVAVMFTSGTTGTPKGVVNRDEVFKFNTASLDKTATTGKYLVSTPLYWISNPWLLSLNNYCGSTILLTDRAKAEELLQVITDYKPEQWFTGPSVLIDMCNLTDLECFDTSSLERVLVGGSPVFPHHKKFFCEKLFNKRNIVRTGYGSTEAGMITGQFMDIDSDDPKYGSMGQVANGVKVKIVDPTTGELLGPYQPGEICVKSPSILKSYINRAVTEEELDKDGFWHMGDIGYYDEDEFVYYQTRLKDIMKYRGQQIAPIELETIIMKHPDIIECAVVGKPSPEYGELPTAFVVKKPDSTLSGTELFDFVAKDVIDEKKLRGGIYFVENLPKSSVGKILRKDLVKMLTA